MTELTKQRRHVLPGTHPLLLLSVERAAGGCLATAPQGPTAVNHVGSVTIIDEQVSSTAPPTLEASEPLEIPVVRVVGIEPVASQAELGDDYHLQQAVKPFQGSQLQISSPNIISKYHLQVFQF